MGVKIRQSDGRRRQKRKRNRKAIIITAAAMLAGILLILAGLFGGSVAALFSGSFDYASAQPEDIGKVIKMDIKVMYEDFGIPGKTLQCRTGDSLSIILDFSGAGAKDKSLYYSKNLQHVVIRGTVRAATDEEMQTVTAYLFDQYDYIFYRKIGMDEQTYKETGDPENRLEAFHQNLLDTVVPYCIDVKTVSCFNWTAFIPSGIILFVLSLVLEFCLVLKLKKRIALPVIYGLMIIIPSVLFFNHIRTMLTVKKIADGFYTMKNLECTDTGDMLASGADTANGLLDWIFSKHLYGFPNVFNIDRDHMGFGCAAFAAKTPEGSHLFGRNFDLTETDTLLVYSHPDGAYESVGFADLGIFGVGQNSAISPDSLIGRFIMVITPYAVVDGMNEKGLAAGILTVNIDEPGQDNGKPDLLLYCAIRGILDNCASVDEALEFLESYDIHSDLGCFHLFITDRSGRYVVVEWLDNGMVVTEHPYCTNSVIAPGEYYDLGSPDNRICIIEEDLGPDRIVTGQEAMDILEKVRNTSGLTEWSCVYNLEDLTVSICLDADYENVYSFSLEDLG